MQWSPKQADALDRAAKWLKDPDQQVFRLFGVAGTGKSTLALHIAELARDILRGRVLFCAFTGKAALVMRSKGCVGATTVHKLIYCPAGDPPSPEAIAELREKIRRLADVNEAGARRTVEGLREQLACAEEDSKRKGPRFALNVASEITSAALVIVDECSMLDGRIGRDLESFGVKILAMGDPAQLPPVFGTGYFMDAEPDVMLDEIHRQALDSPILKLATLARRGERLPYGQIGEGVEVLRYGDPSLEARAMRAEMIIVGRNRTRHASNIKMRRLLGRGDQPAPVKGDRVVCRRNNHEIGLLNGSLWTVERCVPDFNKMTARIEVVDTDGIAVETTCWLHPLMGREDELDQFARREYDEFQYGYAITCHASQGSQYDDVLLFDESRQFGRDSHRHLYTAITRAAKTLTVVQ